MRVGGQSPVAPLQATEISGTNEWRSVAHGINSWQPNHDTTVAYFLGQTRVLLSAQWAGTSSYLGCTINISSLCCTWLTLQSKHQQTSMSTYDMIILGLSLQPWFNCLRSEEPLTNISSSGLHKFPTMITIFTLYLRLALHYIKRWCTTLPSNSRNLHRSNEKAPTTHWPNLDIPDNDFGWSFWSAGDDMNSIWAPGNVSNSICLTSQTVLSCQSVRFLQHSTTQTTDNTMTSAASKHFTCASWFTGSMKCYEAQ